MIPGMRPNQVAINDAGSGYSSPSLAPQAPEENNTSIFPDNAVGEIGNPEVILDDETITRAISELEPTMPPTVDWDTTNEEIDNVELAPSVYKISSKISRLSDGTNEEIYNILQKEAKEDDLGLFDEYGLMTSNFNEIIDAYQSGTDSIILEQYKNGDITVKYDSDNDGVYDRTARYSTDGKYRELFDVAGDGTNDVILSFGLDGEIEEYARDTTNDGDYDYIEYSTEDGSNHKVVYDEKTGNIKYNDITYHDGSRFFEWDENPTQDGLEGSVYIDPSGKMFMFNKELPDAPPAEAPEDNEKLPDAPSVEVPEDNEVLPEACPEPPDAKQKDHDILPDAPPVEVPEDNEVLPEAPISDETQNSNQTPHTLRPNIRFRENYTIE
ncbi:MAG: hypothetical protein IKU37_05440 [Candidatus Gastranaerophilales bacterium]|nr:hypothetical protein [Candidatus Gastranaerophilales bacterium]